MPSADNLRGLWLAALSYILWGLLPIYWKFLDALPPTVILAHRILWALVFTGGLLALRGQLTQLGQLFAAKRTLGLAAAAAVLITFNWGLYIWAVTTDQLVETALGYYINPLLSVALALLVLKERLNRWQGLAFAAAFAGVVVLTVLAGRVPWIALSLAASFALYGLVKKTIALPPLTSLTVETLFALPLAALLFVQGGGFYPLPADSGGPAWPLILLSLGAGPMTALPLWLFASAAQKIPLVYIGFLQYLAPSINLFLGVIIYREAFGWGEGIAFGLIWLGLGLFSFDQLRRLRRRPPPPAAPKAGPGPGLAAAPALRPDAEA